MKALAKAAGAMFAVVATLATVSSNEMSLASVFELYEPWLMMRLTAKVVPPAVLETAPRTTIVLAPERPTVQ